MSSSWKYLVYEANLRAESVLNPLFLPYFMHLQETLNSILCHG